MVKRPLFEAAWILGLLAGIICIFFAILGVLGDIPELLQKPIKSLTDMVSALILGILAFMIIGASRMTRSGGGRATTGGLLLLIFGFAAYLMGGAMGALLAILAGLIAIIARYV